MATVIRKLTWSPLPYVAFGYFYSNGEHLGRQSNERWVLLLGLFSLRLHRFHVCAAETKPHSHPWWFFITFPFGAYDEVYYPNGIPVRHTVRPWRPHYRHGSYAHIFIPPTERKVWTLVFTCLESFRAARG